MERLVGVDHVRIGRRARSLGLLPDPEQLVDLRVGGGLRQPPHRSLLEGEAHLVELLDTGQVRLAHPVTGPALGVFQEAFLHQTAEGVANRGPADAELGGEGLLAHPGAGEVLPQREAPFELMVHAVAEQGHGSPCIRVCIQTWIRPLLIG